MHKRKWKVVLYNIAMWMLFAIGTVLGLFLLSWSTFHFFKDSTTLKNIIENQLKLRNIDIWQMKEDATGWWKVDIPSSTTKQVPVLVIPLDSSKKDSK
jgi:heme/copper-type cytochrome/quinol oxidase subunit 2